MKVYLSGSPNNTKVHNWFIQNDFEVTTNLVEANAIVFLLKDARLPCKFYGTIDELESEPSEELIKSLTVVSHLFNNYVGKKLFIGFNTSALALAAFSNCEIIHWLEGHKTPHHVKSTFEQQVMYMATTPHTQAIYPYNTLDDSEYEVLLTPLGRVGSNEEKSPNNEFDIDESSFEVEAIHFKNTNSLCFQFNIDDVTQNKYFFDNYLKNQILKCHLQNLQLITV